MPGAWVYGYCGILQPPYCRQRAESADCCEPSTSGMPLAPEPLTKSFNMQESLVDLRGVLAEDCFCGLQILK